MGPRCDLIKTAALSNSLMGTKFKERERGRNRDSEGEKKRKTENGNLENETRRTIKAGAEGEWTEGGGVGRGGFLAVSTTFSLKVSGQSVHVKTICRAV